MENQRVTIKNVPFSVNLRHQYYNEKTFKYEFSFYVLPSYLNLDNEEVSLTTSQREYMKTFDFFKESLIKQIKKNGFCLPNHLLIKDYNNFFKINNVSVDFVSRKVMLFRPYDWGSFVDEIPIEFVVDISFDFVYDIQKIEEQEGLILFEFLDKAQKGFLKNISKGRPFYSFKPYYGTSNTIDSWTFSEALANPLTVESFFYLTGKKNIETPQNKSKNVFFLNIPIIIALSKAFSVGLYNLSNTNFGTVYSFSTTAITEFGVNRQQMVYHNSGSFEAIFEKSAFASIVIDLNKNKLLNEGFYQKLHENYERLNENIYDETTGKYVTFSTKRLKIPIKTYKERFKDYGLLDLLLYFNYKDQELNVIGKESMSIFDFDKDFISFVSLICKETNHFFYDLYIQNKMSFKFNSKIQRLEPFLITAEEINFVLKVLLSVNKRDLFYSQKDLETTKYDYYPPDVFSVNDLSKSNVIIDFIDNYSTAVTRIPFEEFSSAHYRSVNYPTSNVKNLQEHKRLIENALLYTNKNVYLLDRKLTTVAPRDSDYDVGRILPVNINPQFYTKGEKVKGYHMGVLRDLIRRMMSIIIEIRKLVINGGQTYFTETLICTLYKKHPLFPFSDFVVNEFFNANNGEYFQGEIKASLFLAIEEAINTILRTYKQLFDYGLN